MSHLFICGSTLVMLPPRNLLRAITKVGTIYKYLVSFGGGGNNQEDTDKNNRGEQLRMKNQ